MSPRYNHASNLHLCIWGKPFAICAAKSGNTGIRAAGMQSQIPSAKATPEKPADVTKRIKPTADLSSNAMARILQRSILRGPTSSS